MIKIFGRRRQFKLFQCKIRSNVKRVCDLKCNWTGNTCRNFNTTSNNHNNRDVSIVTVDKLGVKTNAGSRSAVGIGNNHVMEENDYVVQLCQENAMEIIKSSIPTIIEAYQNTDAGVKFSQKLFAKVKDHLGFLRIARFDPMTEPELAMSLQIAQVPSTIGLINGQAATYFFGIADDKILDNFVTEMLKLSGREKAMDLFKKANDLREQGHIESAKSLYNEILQNSSFKFQSTCLTGLARCFIDEDKTEQAQQLLDTIERDYPNDINLPHVVQVKSILTLRDELYGEDLNLEQLRKRVESEKTDKESHYKLVQALWKHQLFEDSVAELLALIKKDKNWNNQAGRKLLIKFFEVLGSDNPITINNRRKLGNIWY